MENRPSFDEIVRVMQGEVTEEVLRKEEPLITVCSVEDDDLYQERMGKDEQFEEEEEEEEGALSETKTIISKKKHEEVLKELKERVRHLEERERARQELETLTVVEPPKQGATKALERTPTLTPRENDGTADKELGDLMAMMNR